MIDVYTEMVSELPQQFQLERYKDSYIGDFVCDTVDGLDSLPEDCEMGSIARVIEPPSIYRKQSTGTWKFQITAKTGEEAQDGV